MKRALKKLLFPFASFILAITSPVWGSILKFMARTGLGTDICMKYGLLPMPINFYSPVPDIGDLEKRAIWERKSALDGLSFQPDQQVELIQRLGKEFGHECNWPASRTGDEYEFFTENGSFSFGCAASLYTVIRHFKPKRLIEIGSGNSSLVFAQAIAQNRADGLDSDYIIIDPYPSRRIEHGLPCLTKLLKTRVELVKEAFFDELQANDILFVDSGHVVRIGGDVNYLILDTLPRLKKGVIVHFHDIPMPYEYSKIYFTNPAFRVFWTESYLLQAFLSFNSKFEILLAMSYLMTLRMREFRAAFPGYDPNLHLAGSGSFWIRRTA